MKSGKGGPTYGYGQGPACVGGQFNWYSAGEQGVVVMTDPRYTGPVLVRIRRLDGAGVVTISGPGQALADNAFGILESSSPPYWGVWFGGMAPSAPGCYGVQFAGMTYSDAAVINVSEGPPPPGLAPARRAHL